MKKMFFLILISTVSFVFGLAFQNFTTKQEEKKEMKRVTSIGGIFFKCKEPEKVKEWYSKHLGLKTDEYGTTFEWRHSDEAEKKGFTVWSPFADSTNYFDPSKKEFMINYRVENIEWLVEELKKEGVQVVDNIETYDYGKFVHIIDIEGNKIELWESDDAYYDKMLNVRTK